jgi:NitT/TauT family transport system substrate-binding protein
MRYALLTGFALVPMLLAACGPAPSAPAPTSPPAPTTAAAPVATKPPAAAQATAAPQTQPTAAPQPKPTAAPQVQPTAAAQAQAAPLKLTQPLPPLDPPLAVKARVGSSLTTAPFWYAIEKGYFQQLGLKFETVEIPNSGDVISPLTQGQLDIAGTSFGAGLYNAVGRDIDVKAVADNGQLDEHVPGAAAVVKKGQAAVYGDGWCALKGKRVAVVSKSTGLYPTLVKALETCKLGPDDVDLVELGFPETNIAIAQGSVDVGFQVEPFVSRGVADGTLDLWHPLDEAYKGQQMNLLLYSPQFIKNREAGLRFMVAYLAGARDYRRAIEGKGDRQEMDQILAKYLPVKDPKAYEGMIMMGIDPNGEIDLPSVKESITIFQETGSVPNGPIQMDWVADDLRQQAIQLLGPYTP